MIIIIYSDRAQILQYLAPLREIDQRYLWAIDPGMAISILSSQNVGKAEKVIVHPGFNDISDWWRSLALETAQLIWLTAPNEEIKTPDMPGVRTSQMNTGLSPDEFCRVATSQKG